MINVYAGTLRDRIRRPSDERILFHRWDDGDVHTQCQAGSALNAVPGSIAVLAADTAGDVQVMGKPNDQIRILVVTASSSDATGAELEADGRTWRVVGYVRDGDQWQPQCVSVIPLREQLYSRTRGLLETDLLADVRVLIAGLGSVGSKVSPELATLGLAQILVDHDRVEVGNVTRQGVGLSSVGRLKVNAVRDAIRDKNPFAEVETHAFKITWDAVEQLRALVRRMDLGICALDNHEARTIWNMVCVDERKPYLMGGAFHRAYGVQILYVRPGETLCYQCFAMGSPKIAHDREIASPQAAALYAYADRPVEPAPGLSNDIAPLNQMMVKLGIQHLSKGRSEAFRSLDAELTVPSWWIWLNRREPGTDYENLKPLGSVADGPRILCWYPIARERERKCPCCRHLWGKLRSVKTPARA